MHLFPRPFRGNESLDAEATQSLPKPVQARHIRLPKVVRPHFTPHQSRLAAFEKAKRLRKLHLANADSSSGSGRFFSENDSLDRCAPYTESYNALLRQTGKKDRTGAVRIALKMKERGVPMNLQTYNLLLDILADTGDDSAFRVYEEMKEEAAKNYSAEIAPDLATYTILLRACERSGAYDKAFQLFQEMKAEFALQPDVSFFNTLIGFCVSIPDEHTASELFAEMLERGVQPNVHTYNSMLNVFSSAPLAVIEQMFNDMPNKGISPNLRTFNTVMKVCQRLSDYPRVFSYFDELKESGIPPNVVTFNILLDVCLSRLEELSTKPPAAAPRRVSSPTVSPAAPPSTLSPEVLRPLAGSEEDQDPIASAVKQIAVTALALFQEMVQQRSLLPNTKSYNAVLAVLAAAGDPKVFEVFEQMQQQQKAQQQGGGKGKKLSTAGAAGAGVRFAMTGGSSDDSLLGLPAIPGASSRGGGGSTSRRRQPSSTSPLGEEAASPEQRGAGPRGGRSSTSSIADELSSGDDCVVEADLKTYTSLLLASEKLGMFEKALELFDEMLAVGIKPDKLAYTKMIDACALKADVARARALFAECRAKQIIIDVDLYNSLLRVLAEATDPSVQELFEEMLAAGIRPNPHTYNALLRYCEKAEEGTRAFALYTEMCSRGSTVKPNLTTYSILMDICGQRRDTERVRELLADMRKRGLPISVSTVNRVMRVLALAQDPGVVEYFEMIHRDGPAPNLESYVILLGYYCVKGDELILVVFDDLKGRGIAPDLRVFNIMLDYCGRIQDKRKSLRFFEELKVRGLTADVETYNALMAVFAESGDPLILKVFEEMNENQIEPNPSTFSILIKHKRSLECLKHAAEQRLLLPPELARWIQAKEAEAALRGLDVTAAAGS
eukprot:RCo044860